MDKKKSKKISFRTWVTVITFTLLAITIYFAWPEVKQAWGLMGKVNIWIFLLLIPVQIISYYAVGGLIFSYLEAKQKIKGLTHWVLTRISLELNFVNHILPSGGVVGFTYLSWILKEYGVSPARSTMSQIVRFALTFVSFLLLMFASLGWMIFDHQVSRALVITCLVIAVGVVMALSIFIYGLSSHKRLEKLANFVVRTGNKLIKLFTLGRKRNVVKYAPVNKFFDEIYDDFKNIKRDKKILWKPFLWSMVAQMMDVMLYVIAFWSLGVWVNPAILLIGLGLSSLASIVSITPAGAGVNEAIMIGFLVSSGVSLDVALAGTLLTRVSLVTGTIVFGYFFYQMTVSKYGKAPVQR